MFSFSSSLDWPLPNGEIYPEDSVKTLLFTASASQGNHREGGVEELDVVGTQAKLLDTLPDLKGAVLH